MGYTESHTYDYLGNMLSQTDKNGNTVTFEDNTFGLASKTDGETEIVNTYNGIGQLVLANTTGRNQTSYAYDPLVTLGTCHFCHLFFWIVPLNTKKGDESLKKLKLISVLLTLLLLVSVVPVSAETTEAVSGITINNVTYEVTGINDEFIKITAGCTEQEGVTAVSVMVVPENTETVALNDIIYINRFGKSNNGEYTITLRKSKILEKTNNSALVQVV